MKTAFFTFFCAGLLLITSFRRPLQHVSVPSQDETETYYIVIADTSQSYEAVHATMMKFREASGQEIDTMGRYYNAKLNKLMLPEDDEDELYRGEYYPRRFPDATLSIEYLATYTEASPATFACVTGIYEKAAQAKKAVSKWKSRFPKIYSLKAEVYTGCMH
jgi:hypothetical protein